MHAARRATWLTFFLTGAVFASFASRIPAIQDRLDLSAGTLSLAFLSLNAGAVAGLPAGGVLCGRIGARTALRWGFAIYPPMLVVVGFAPGLGWLCAALVVTAVANSVIDVAMNVEGVELERRFGRPILSGLHAGHSLGVLAGATAGFALASAGVPALVHFALVAAPALVAGLAATTRLVETRPEEEDRGRPARPGRRTAVLGAVAFCAFACEGGANDWSAVHLRTAHGADEGLAAGAFAAYSLTLSLGRLVGDRVVARLGRVRAVRAGGLLAAAGLGLALTAGSAAPAIVGWASFGAGLSVLAPTILGAAAGVAGTTAPVAIATVSALGYLGAFTGPPAIGALAEATSLPVALVLLVAAALAAATLASAVRPREPARVGG